MVRLYLFFLGLVLMVSLSGCVTMEERSTDRLLAIVNGRPITETDLLYDLQIEHRREDLSGAGSFDLERFLQKVIDDTLIVEEAERMGLGDSPFVQAKVRQYIIREDVTRLYQEEILSKIEVTEEEARRYYQEMYEVFRVSIIETDSPEKAKEAERELSEGGDFSALVKRYGGREDVKYTRLALARSPEFEELVLGLKAGQWGGPAEIDGIYYIVKLIRRDPPEGRFEERKTRVIKQLKKEKERELSDRYLQQLRQKSQIWVNEALIAELKESDDLKPFRDDTRVLARVDGEELRVSALFSPEKTPSPLAVERLVQNWIDRKVVDLEALRRGYHERSPLREQVRRYRDQILKRVFIGTVVLPQIKRDDRSLREYYKRNMDRYRRPTRYRLQEIVLKSREDAEEVLKQLKKGADFGWLARTRSVASTSKRGGEVGWVTLDGLSEPVRNAVRGLTVGGISGVIDDGEHYRIVRLVDRREGQVPDFGEIRSRVLSDYTREEITKKLREYVEQLRRDAEIEVFEDVLKALKERFSGEKV